MKAEVSKVDYWLKPVGSDVQGVDTFFDTCSNLGQLSSYNLKNLGPSDIVRNVLRSFLNMREISALVGLLERENSEFWIKSIFLIHKYSTRIRDPTRFET